MRQIILSVFLASAFGCAPDSGRAPVDAGGPRDGGLLDALPDSPDDYIDSVDYRRAILERDTRRGDNEYARERLAKYGLAGEGWELLPARDPLTRPLSLTDLARAQRGEPLVFDPGTATSLVPERRPQTEAAWIELGRRVFFEYPLRVDSIYSSLVGIEGGIERAGFLTDADTIIGLRVLLDDDGNARIGNTCAQCHGTYEPDGTVSGQLANRRMDVGAARLLVLGITPDDLPSEIDSTRIRDLARLGPGRGDVQADDLFNPFAFPDFGGIADLPYLQHNANWYHRGTTTLAIRCETLFITAAGRTARIPRVLSWAIAAYFRSLAPPAPLFARDEEDPEWQQGEALFESAGCTGCHVPPLFTSAREVSVEEIGTDALAGDSPIRGTQTYRIPSLRGVGRTAPYLHHGAFDTLEQMFDPERAEPGHTWGLSLDAAERRALLVYLRTL